MSEISANIAMLKGMKKESDLVKYAKKHGYHIHIDTLPIYNWFKCSEGDLSYLHKKKMDGYPRFFVRVLNEMVFQSEQRDNSIERDKAKARYLESLFLTTGDPKYSNMYRSLDAKIKKDKEQQTHKNKSKLNDLVNVIEETFSDIGSIDVHKMTTSRFFSLYNRAVDKIKVKNKQHVNN